MRNRARYPKDWLKRRKLLREQAGNCCQKCGIEHGTIRLSYSGNLWPVYLQCAHINHDPENEHAEIAVVCPKCHWKHYKKPGQSAGWMIEKMRHKKLIQEAYCR